MTGQPLLLDHVYLWERTAPDEVWLTQPVSEGELKTYTWSQVVDEARRIAAHIQSFRFAPASQIAILSKNCAEFIIADLAIWMAGHASVAVYPTLNADSVRFILEHSESRLVFVGKLDDWQTMSSGVPEHLPRIAFRKILAALGLDAVRFAVSGSAPIPAELVQWYQDLGLELLEGYGTTEDFACSHTSELGKGRVGYVGTAYPGVQVRISEEGEILINVNPNVELACVSGSGRPHPFAVVALTEDLRDGIEDLHTHRRVHGELEALLAEVNCKVEQHEQLRFIAIAKEPWLIENGFLTPTMKIRRARVEEAYEPLVDAW